MPELPEVETVRAWLAPALAGATLSRVELRRDDLRYPIPVALVQAQVGRLVTAVRRRAKYLLIDTAPQPTVAADESGASALLIHLGMSGRCWLESDPVDPPPWRKHEHWRMWLHTPQHQHLLRYQDARRFGALDVVEATTPHRLLVGLGHEPFDSAFNGAWLHASTRNRKTAIKTFLMDATRLVGVGNIYASEACWRARVHPLKPAAKVGRAAADRLVVGVRDVLREAIAAGGSTLKDFVGGDENPGYFQQRLDVYGRGGEPCHRCGDDPDAGDQRPIVRVVLLGRATYFCAACQR
mgnify:FL=1